MATNRTTLELKRKYNQHRPDRNHPTNRTTLELKLLFQNIDQVKIHLPIAPHWN